MNIPELFRHTPRPCNVPMQRWQAPSSVTWDRAPGVPSIAEDEVHVWVAGLGADEAQLEACRRTISDAESARAARFLASRDRNRYVVGRSVLREILSIYLGMTPREICLRVNRWGKPVLTSQGRGRHLQFSISHSLDVLLVAVAGRGLVGVDVERIDQTLDWMPVAELILSRSEGIALREVPEVHRRAAFYSLWTQWEALSKAIGGGLSLPRTTMVSAERRGNSIGSQDNIWEGPGGGLWRTRILTPQYGYVAALAVGPSSAAHMKFHFVAREAAG